MSYRELRSFTEVMRALSYPRPISVDNFRTPNFPLVAEILLWLVERYDPSSSVPENIDTEAARVTFLTAVAQVMAAKARIQLKTRSLYAADGRAVKEMLKIAKLLYTAVRMCKEGIAKGEDEDAPQGAEDFTLSVRPTELAALRSTASEITERGAKLYELLKRETELKDARFTALRFLEAVSSSLDARAENEYIERSVRDAIASMKEHDDVQDNVTALERQAAEAGEDERTLASKLSKKQAELARLQKRLESLASVRPAFMDEYEKLERELAEEYDAYVTRYRNLQYLEHELDEFNKREKAKMEASSRALQKLQKKLKEEEFKAFRGDENVADDDAPPAGGQRTPVMRAAERGRDPAPKPAATAARAAAPRPGAVPNGRQGSAGQPRVVGRMDGPQDDDDDEDEDDDDEDEDDDEDLPSDDEDLGDDDEDMDDDDDGGDF